MEGQTFEARPHGSTFASLVAVCEQNVISIKRIGYRPLLWKQDLVSTVGPSNKALQAEQIRGNPTKSARRIIHMLNLATMVALVTS